VERLVACGYSLAAGPTRGVCEPHGGIRLGADAAGYDRCMHRAQLEREDEATCPLACASPGGRAFDHCSGRAEAPCLMVGEVAQAHDGSLVMAHAFIDAIAAGGADAVTFQTHIGSAERTPGEPWRVRSACRTSPASLAAEE